MSDIQKLSDTDIKKILIALGLYLTAIFASNTIGLKVMPFLFDSHLTVAVFYFPIVFLMTDVVGEVYGRKVAKMFVRIGFLSIAVFLAFTFLSLAMPWSPDGEWVREGYDQVFGISVRMAIASLAAFLIAEYQDVLSFFFFRDKIGKRFFGLRSFLSNVWSQLIDSAIFMIIAFVGVYPISVLISLSLTLWLYKVAMGAIYTPLSYLGVRILRGSSKGEESASVSV
jgi:uncharacterized integral membrane protein (TIGR00697 family)